MRTLLLGALVLLLGCEPEEFDTWNERQVGSYPEYVCIGGVKYYWLWRRMAPAYNRDGTLILCDEERK